MRARVFTCSIDLAREIERLAGEAEDPLEVWSVSFGRAEALEVDTVSFIAYVVCRDADGKMRLASPADTDNTRVLQDSLEQTFEAEIVLEAPVHVLSAYFGWAAGHARPACDRIRVEQGESSDCVAVRPMTTDAATFKAQTDVH